MPIPASALGDDMAKSNYICCDHCDSSIVYDGDGTIMEALTALGLDNAQVLCEACRKTGVPDAAGIEAAAFAYERLYIDTEGQCSPHDVATAVVAAFFAVDADVPEEEDTRQICPECGGDGYVASRDAPHQWADDSNTEGDELVTCRECCGLGYL